MHYAALSHMYFKTIKLYNVHKYKSKIRKIDNSKYREGLPWDIKKMLTDP